MEKTRLRYFDIAKGIGILSVIAGHMKFEFVKTIIYSFHMPLFFLISGYFLKKEDSRVLMKKRGRQLILPYIFTVISLMILTVISDINYNRSGSIVFDLKDLVFAAFYGSGLKRTEPFLVPSIGAVWFLLALFTSQIIVNECIKRKYSYVWIAIIAYIGWVSSKVIWLPFSVQAGMTAAVYVYIGYIANEKDILNKKIPVLCYLPIIFMWGLLIKIGSNIDMVSCYFGDGIFDFIGSISASFIILKLCQYAEAQNFKSTGILEFCGRNSLIILCFHLMELKIFKWKFIYNFAKMAHLHVRILKIILFSAKLSWCIMGVVIVNKVSIFRKIFSIKINKE